MNNIQIFQNEQFGQVRIAMDESNEPLFCLADVCNVIGIANARNVKSRLEDDDVRRMDTADSLGRIQQVTFVTESGLYDVIIRSDSEKAKPFRKWVSSEVLPSIRKHGAYMLTTDNDTPETIMAKAIMYADQKIKEQAKRLEEEKAVRYELEQEAVANKPKIDWAVRNQESKGLHTVTGCLQDTRICADFMNKCLERYKIQRKLSGEWVLTTSWQNKGFGELVPAIIEMDGVEAKTRLQLKWSEKGRHLMLQLIPHAEQDGYIHLNKKGRYSITKGGCAFTEFKFID